MAGPTYFTLPASFLKIPAHTSRLRGRGMKPAGNIDTGTEQRFRDALTSVHGEVAQVLSITGVAEVIPVAASVADAVAALAS